MSLIDILIPNYQYGRYLSQCVNSILRQGIEDIRILIIDNASTDDSVAVANKFAATDPRIEVRARSRNLGPHASFNEGVDWAQSKYFLILCADDLLTEGALPRAVSIMEGHPELSFAYGACIEYRKEEDLSGYSEEDLIWEIESGEDFIRRACRKIPYIMSPLVRTSCQKLAGYYRPELPFNDDVEMQLRLACYGKVARTASFQAIQRLHEGNVSSAVWKDPLRDVVNDIDLFASFFRNEGSSLADSKCLWRIARHRIGERAYWRAMSLIVQRQYSPAAKLFAKSLQLSPSNAVFPPVHYLLQRKQPFRRISQFIAQSWIHSAFNAKQPQMGTYIRRESASRREGY
jgi:glycosyltransferase involved in cell wall biosynthesis